MTLRRALRRLAPAALTIALVAGSGVPAAAESRGRDDGKARQEAKRDLNEARKAEEKRRGPVRAELKGTISAVAPAAKVFSLEVKRANQGALRSQTIRITLAPTATVTVNDRRATLADARVGDAAHVQGVTGADGKVTAFKVRLSRRAPVPQRVEGTVLAADPLVLFAKGMRTPIQMATPSIITLNDATVPLADIEAGDRCSALGIPTPTGLVVFHLACLRP